MRKNKPAASGYEKTRHVFFSLKHVVFILLKVETSHVIHREKKIQSSFATKLPTKEQNEPTAQPTTSPTTTAAIATTTVPFASGHGSFGMIQLHM
jgi:hypothetical protein